MESASSGYAVQQSASNARVDIEIPDTILSKFESLPDSVPNSRGHAWTKEEDAILLRFWPVKNHSAVSKTLGVCTNVALRRYRELTEEK